MPNTQNTQYTTHMQNSHGAAQCNAQMKTEQRERLELEVGSWKSGE